MPYQLDERLAFPHPALADEDGLLAIGGDLSLERLLLAYQHGIFPWYDEHSPILWYAPHERFVLNPKAIKISKSMRQFMRRTGCQVHTNRAFDQVIAHCGNVPRRGQEGTWITTEMQAAYQQLHRAGYAHSIETYNEADQLIGGLYGVQVGGVFCGESMFSLAPNASKLALIYLCQQFNFQWIDCQIYSEHLSAMGADYMSGETYYQILQQQSLVPYLK